MADFFQLTNENIFLAVAISFAGGFMTSLTPCVYPVILITVAVFGARETKSRLQAFALSLTFAGAIIIMYTSLGIVSALTGTLFGKIYTSRWFIFGIAGLFVLMALSLFGLFTLQLPESMRTKFATAGKAGYAGAFIMGLVSGLLAAPCTGPILIGILAFVSGTKSVFIGGTLLFAYALGLTLIFIVVGTFVMSLPKSGKWLDAVKDILGGIMLILAVYFLRYAAGLHDYLPESPPNFILLCASAAAVVGLLLIILSHTLIHKRLIGENESPVSMKRRGAFQLVRILSIALLLTGASAAIVSATARPVDLNWIVNNEQKALDIHREGKKPMLIDFTANWCEACGDIDRKTFTNENVKKELARFVLLRMDLSEMTEKDDKTRKKYKVGGLPTLLIYDSGGKEASRITDFIGPEKFIQVIKKTR